MSDTNAQKGVCPNCDARGLVGKPCGERGCRKRGYHFIPTRYAVKLGEDAEGDGLIGRTIGDYLVVGVIGQGGFGRVYMALQMPILMSAALKLMDKSKFERAVMKAMLKQFEGEAAALAALNHPNIVRLLKYGTHAEMPYLVMEYVSNAVTLKREVANRALKSAEFRPAEVLEILRQIVSGLEAAHMRDIVHRDIKPDNIMLQELPGHPTFVRILDFGMAKFVQDTADTKFAMGTPAYMAPEQLTRKGIGPWTDLYAVGVIAFELISGRRPFVGRTHQEILARKVDPRYDPVARLSDLPLPDLVRSFLTRALAHEAANRFQTAAEFRDALEQVFEALERSPSDATMSVELSELVDSSADVNHLHAERAKLEAQQRELEAQRQAMEAERHRLAEERRRLDSRRGVPAAVPPPTSGATAAEGEQERLRRLIDEAQARADWPTAIELKTQLVELVDGDMERFMLQMSIGDIHRTRLGYTAAAADAYAKALSYGSFSKAPLLHLVQIGVNAKRYDEAIGYLKQLIDSEPDPAKKAVYAMSVGVLYRDGLDDVDRAVEFLELALDADPHKIKAFQIIESMLTERGWWRSLARAHHAMILRVRRVGRRYENAAGVLFGLYKRLGAILLEHLEDQVRATEAFEAAFLLRPHDQEVREALLMLYEEQGLNDKAAEQYRLRIKVHQDDFESYRALARLYKAQDDVDRAWLVTGLLCAAGRASEAEREWYDGLRGASRPLVPFDDELWAQLVVGPQDAPVLGHALGLTFGALGPHLNTSTIRDLRLRRKDRLDPGKSPLASRVRALAEQLGVPMPEVYVDREHEGVEALPVLPPALRVGRTCAEGFRAGGDDALTEFLLAKQLAMFHRWHMLGVLFDDAQLLYVLLSARRVALPDAPLPHLPGVSADERRHIVERVTTLSEELDRQLSAPAREELVTRVQGALAGPSIPDVGAWRRLAEMTATHAALAACGDVAAAGRALKAELPELSVLTVDEKVRDLVLWVLSARFRAARERLGASVG